MGLTSNPLVQDYYCSEACAHNDWKVHRQDCKHKGKIPPPFGSPRSEASESILDSTATGSSHSQALGKAGGIVPKRKFRDDGTVKIYNAHKPDPEMYRGEPPPSRRFFTGRSSAGGARGRRGPEGGGLCRAMFL